MESPKPDVVCPLRASHLGIGYEEFRYALRSLERNAPGSEVWALGGKPRWMSKKANHVPLVQNATKYQNVRRMIAFACREPAISDPFVLTNDDVFWLLPGTPMLHGGPALKYLTTMKSRVGNSSYVRGGFDTVKMLGGGMDVMQFSLHTPILVHKAAMLEAVAMCEDTHKPLHLRTIYAKLQGLEGREHSDVKIVSAKLPPGEWHYVSTSDTSFQHKAVGKMLKERFSTRSRFELP